jgi:hypothetical protein
MAVVVTLKVYRVYPFVCPLQIKGLEPFLVRLKVYSVRKIPLRKGKLAPFGCSRFNFASMSYIISDIQGFTRCSPDGRSGTSAR